MRAVRAWNFMAAFMAAIAASVIRFYHKENTMRYATLLACAILLGPAALVGSSSMARSQGAAHQAKEQMRDATDALSITPQVKSAIIADPQLNNRRNHINVGTKDYVLHLTGHVVSQAMRSRAAKVAAGKLNAMHKKYKVSNELSVAR